MRRIIALGSGQRPGLSPRAGGLKGCPGRSTNLNLWWNLWNDKYAEGFSALTQWANEYVAFPGEFFRSWIKDFYQDNKLHRGGVDPVSWRVSCFPGSRQRLLPRLVRDGRRIVEGGVPMARVVPVGVERADEGLSVTDVRGRSSSG